MKMGPTATLGGFSDTLTGLSSNTTYYYRAFAQTSVEVTYGDIQSL